MTDIITFDAATKTITKINTSFKGDLTIERKYNDVDVITIKDGACLSGALRSLDASNTVIERIEGKAFLSCGSLVSVKLPSTISYLGDNSFALTGITNFTVPKSTTRFTGYVVNQCPHLNQLFVEEGNEKFIAKDNFIFNEDSTILVRAPINAQINNIPCFKNVKMITAYALSGCEIKTFIASSNLTYLKSRSLHACPSLRRVDLYLSNITILEKELFISTRSVDTLILPRNLLIIRNKAMGEAPRLKELIIPESVNTIEENAIGSLNSITDIYLLCQHQSSFEKASILSNIYDSRKGIHIHANESYEGTVFGGFSVNADLLVALAKRMEKKNICTMKIKRTISNSIFIVVLIL